MQDGYDFKHNIKKLVKKGIEQKLEGGSWLLPQLIDYSTVERGYIFLVTAIFNHFFRTTKSH